MQRSSSTYFDSIHAVALQLAQDSPDDWPPHADIHLRNEAGDLFPDLNCLRCHIEEIVAKAKQKSDAPASETPKDLLCGLFRDNPATPEGKYLVKRRDGSVVEWPSFVLGARDPYAPTALRAYAKALQLGMETGDAGITPEFIAAVYRWADTFDAYRLDHGEGDPGRGRHRRDDPATIAEMRKGMSA